MFLPVTTPLNWAAAARAIEPVANQENQYYIYTMVNESKRYIRQTEAGKNTITLSENNGTALALTLAGNGKFYIKHSGENRWLQHSNGGGGIRFYTDKNNATNSQISFTYADSVTVPDDVYDLDGQTWGIVYDSESLFCTALMSDVGETAGTLKGQDMISLATLGHENHLFVPLSPFHGGVTSSTLVRVTNGTIAKW